MIRIKKVFLILSLTTLFVINVGVNFSLGIARDQVIANAEAYATHSWYCSTENASGCNWGGCPVSGSAFNVGWHTGVAYKWGGFDSITDFDQKLAQGYTAGDVTGTACVAVCATGVDCSGYVSRCWGLTSKYSTSTLPDISTQIPQDSLSKGDILNDPGNHVVLFHYLTGNGSPVVYESVYGSPNKVIHHTVSWSSLNGYTPRIYNNIEESDLTIYDFWKKPDPIYADPSSYCDKPNFDAQYKVRNDGSQPITIERLALAIHDSNNNHKFDLGIENTCTPRYYDNVTLNPGETHWFILSTCYFQSAGSFKVVAKAKLGGQWNELASMDFEVLSPIIPPSTPSSITYPSSACENQGFTVSWSSVSTATSYELQRATNSGFSDATTIYTGYSTSYNQTGLGVGTYYYRVIAKNSCGSSGWRAGGAIVVSSAPSTPSNPSPLDGATGVSVNPTLIWTSPDATSWDVYFGTSSPPPKVATVTTTSYMPGTLNPGTQYFWKIVAINTCGSSEGPEWHFTTIGCPLPTVPTNPSPPNATTNVSIDTDLDWDNSAGADSYNVYFGTTSPPAYSGNTTSSFYDLPKLECNAHYYWKIVAKNGCGETSGDEWDFTTEDCKKKSQRLTNTSTSSTWPIQARSGAYVYVVWKEGNYVYFRRNTNYGASGSWDSAVKLTTWGELDTWNNTLDIAAIGSYVYIAMACRTSSSDDYEIWFIQSSNNGQTWGSWQQLSKNAGESRRPTLACYSSYVWIAWQDDNPGNYEIFFKRGVNNGTTWGSVQRLSYSAGGSHYPCLAAGGGYVYLVWEDSNPGNYEIYFKRNTYYGISSYWSSVWRLTYNSGFSWYPRVACDITTGQYAQVVWSDSNPGNYEIFHKWNNNYGSTTGWSGPKRICYSSGSSYFPDVDCNKTGNLVDIVWCDNNPGNWEIFGKYSSNYGSSFGGVSRWTYNSGSSERPKINSYNMAIVWDDNNPGNKEIFYK